ncbi:MAG: ABC transporter permease [Chloroflexi bacterium]|nr:ABC transporter permease [Chloroflexota bacterium]
MSASRSTEVAFEVAEVMRRRPSRWADLWQFIRIKPVGAAGAAILLLLFFAAFSADVVAPYDPYEMHYDKLFTPPGIDFPLGSDNFGRDLLSRIIFGSRVSLVVGFGAIGAAGIIAMVAGLTSAYFGGKVDLIMQRIMDMAMSFPTLVLALTIVAALGSSLLNVIIAIAIVETPRITRVVRSNALAVKETQYIDAAIAFGAGTRRILFVHMMPNCLAPWIICVTMYLSAAILLEATLSFLGLGVPPPTPSWGGMLSGAGREFVEKAPWMAIYPGLAISAVVFGFNLFGDALRDVLDPRLRR